ncbi:17999_t:CDS:2 [Rhizophagus irregularis]|nr:17999_t:CDS:2 [Rhizophagus irregularis]
MIQETITHQDGTANNTQSSQLSQKKLIFGNVLKFKMNSIRRKNDKLKYQLEECNNKCSNSSLCSDTLEEDQNSQLEVAIINESQPVVSTSVISFSDRGSIKPESTANSSTKSASLFSHFPWNYSSILKHKSSTTSDASTTINNSVDNSQEILVHQENPVDSTKKKKKLFSFSKREPEPIKNWNIKNNNYSNSTVSTSIESSDMDQNDSAYETETDSYCCMKKKEKKGKKKSSKSIKTIKTIRRTKLKTLSPKDEEYIEIKKLFQAGLPNKNILGIIRLQMPTRLIKAHEQFKRELAQNNITSESQICHRMFHGTKTAFICKPQHFINNKCALFCKIGCGVCGIVQEGNKTKYSRYNQRMWFANNSATSLSYCSSNNVKAMFVVDVVSTSPNSILIIEKDEATIPRYLIVFQ